MGVTEDYARLILEAKESGFEGAKKSVADLQQRLADLTASYARGEVEIDEYRQAGLRLQGQLDDEKAALTKAEQALKQHGSAAAASRALGDAAQSSRNLGQAALETSRALEDLQYGVAGVVNNIPSLVMSLGGSAGLTAAISLTAVGINQLVKHWDDITALFQNRNPFPPAADAVTGLKKELEKANEQMKELEKHTSLTDAQLSEFNALREKTARLEKEIADQTERQKALKELHETPTPETKAYAEAFQTSVVATGEGGKFHADIEGAIAEQDTYAQELLDKLTATAADIEKLAVEPEKRARMLDEARAAYAAGIQGIARVAQGRAEDLIAQASKGNKEAYEQIQKIMDASSPARFSAALREGMMLASPAQKALEEQGARNAAEFGVHVKEVTEAQARDRKTRDDLAKDNEAIGTEITRQVSEARDKTAEAQKKSGKEAGDRQAELAKAIGGGGLQLQAEQYALQLKAQGGESDRFGRFVPMGPEQQAARVQSEVGRVVQQAAPELNPIERSGVAQRIAASAQEDLGKRLMGVGTQTQGDQERLTAVGFALTAELEQMGARQRAVGAQIARLEQAVQGMHARQRTAASWPGSH